MKKRTILTVLLILPLIAFIKTINFQIHSHPPLDIMRVSALKLNDSNNHKEMLKRYKRLCLKYPEKAELLYPLGWAYYKTGNKEKARQVFQKYIQLNPFFPQEKYKYMKKAGIRVKGE